MVISNPPVYVYFHLQVDPLHIINIAKLPHYVTYKLSDPLPYIPNGWDVESIRLISMMIILHKKLLIEKIISYYVAW